MKDEFKNVEVLADNGELVGKLLYLLTRCGDFTILPDLSIHGTTKSANGSYTEAHVMLEEYEFLQTEGLYPLGLASNVSYNRGIIAINYQDVLRVGIKGVRTDIDPIRLAKFVIYKLRTEDYPEIAAVENNYRALTKIGTVIDQGYLSFVKERNANVRDIEIRNKQRKLVQSNIVVLKRKDSEEADRIIAKVNALNYARDIHCSMSGYEVKLRDGAVTHQVDLQTLTGLGLQNC